MYKILIRPLEHNDSEISWKWRNDEEVWKYTGSRPNISVTPEIEREWFNKVLNQTSSRRFAITVDDKYVGNIQLTNITSENAEYHIFIGEKDYWGKGIGLSATQQIIRFAKYVLKLKQIYLYVKKENENAVKLYQRCGFVQVSNDIKMILDLNYTNPPQVSVFCMVYNHEPFLEQCLEGLLMQKCLFDFEIVVGEDCSKDKSREILLKYQSKFPGKFNLLLHNQNVGAVNNQNIVLSNCTGKYIAMCEGDDYWTDPLKLQKQVDFLESNPDIVMTYGNATIEDLTETYHKKVNYINGFTAKKIMFHQVIGMGLPTLTMVFRNVLTFPNWFSNVKSGDMFLRLLLSKHGDFYYHGETFGVHRKHEGGVSRTNDKLEWNLNSAKHLKLFLSDCHKNQKESVNKAIAKHYIYAFYTSLMNESSIKPLTLFFKCLSSKGFYTRQGIGLMRLLFKEVILKKNINILDIF